MFRRFILFALQSQRPAESLVNFSDLRLELQRSLKIGHRLIKAILLRIDLTQVKICLCIFGVHPHGLAKFSYRLIDITPAQKQ